MLYGLRQPGTPLPPKPFLIDQTLALLSPSLFSVFFLPASFALLPGPAEFLSLLLLLSFPQFSSMLTVWLAKPSSLLGSGDGMGWGGMWFDSNSMLGALRDHGEKAAPKVHTGPCPFISPSASLFPDSFSLKHFSFLTVLSFFRSLSICTSLSLPIPRRRPTTRGPGQE